MRKTIALFLVMIIGTLGLWNRVFSSYLDVQAGIMQKLSAGDCTGALDDLEGYRSSKSAYIIKRVAFLNTFRLRLRYNEGVLNAKLGNMEVAERAFNDSSGSVENETASSALYNLAIFAVKRNDLRSAQTYLSRSLVLDPSDVESKVNFEVLLRKLRGKDYGIDIGREKDRRASPGVKRKPGEQWRLDIPEEDGQGGTATRRSYL